MTDNGQNHGAALLEVLRDGLGYDPESRDYRVSREATVHAEALIAERDQARNEVMALRIAKEQTEAALDTAKHEIEVLRNDNAALVMGADALVARAEKAEADLEFAHNAKDHWTKKACENLARAEKAEAENEDFSRTVRMYQAEAVDAAEWKERAERAEAEVHALEKRIYDPLCTDALHGHAVWCYRVEYHDSARCCCGVDDDPPKEPAE